MPVALEDREVRNIGPAVAGARGDHHGPGANRAAVGELQAQRRASFAIGAAAIEPGNLQRNGDLGAEFQGLIESAPGERHARDASRKAEIILDPRRGSRLPADRPLVEHDHR